MAATIAVLLAAVMALPVSPYVRWQNLDGTIYARASWIYERIHFDPEPIDVVFMGSSRVGAGVYPTLIEPALAARGIDARVVNFSLPSSGFDVRETILDEVFAEKSPKLVVYSIVEAFPRDGHEAFGEIAPASEVLGAPLLVNRNLPGNVLKLPVRQISLAMASALPAAFGKRGAFDPASYAGTTLDTRDLLDFEDDLSALGTPEHADKLAQQAAQRRRWLTPPILPARLAFVEFGVSRSYVERMVAQAEAHGAKVVFLYLPFFTGPDAPLEADWVQRYGPLWSADFMKDNPLNYEDSAHSAATPRVKAMLSDWFADNIAEALGETGNPRSGNP